MVGSTNLTRHVSERDLAQLIERFESIAVGVVATGGGRVVKTLGDEVLFVADDPVGGSAIGLELLDSFGAERELPDVRIGMAFGHVLRRFGDVYGPVVNVASRLTSAAKPGTVLVDRELATVLAEEATMRLRRRRPISMRGYDRLSPSRLTWALPYRSVVADLVHDHHGVSALVRVCPQVPRSTGRRAYRRLSCKSVAGPRDPAETR